MYITFIYLNVRLVGYLGYGMLVVNVAKVVYIMGYTFFLVLK